MSQKITKTKIVYNRDFDEYVVKAYTDSGRYRSGDYFTNNKEDAKATARAMVNPDLLRQPGYNPREVT